MAGSSSNDLSVAATDRDDDVVDTMSATGMVRVCRQQSPGLFLRRNSGSRRRGRATGEAGSASRRRHNIKQNGVDRGLSIGGKWVENLAETSRFRVELKNIVSTPYTVHSCRTLYVSFHICS